jgi:UDP-N-acetylmuramyl-tripeptide synthetase
MRRLESPEEAAIWLRDRVTGDLQADSRNVRPGDGFIAWPGAVRDARQFVPAALAIGAGACLQEWTPADANESANTPMNDAVGGFEGLKKSAGEIASCYYRRPSEQTKVIAFTGTNGKTSSAWWLVQAMPRIDPIGTSRCGLVGTLGIGIPGGDGIRLQSTGLTTPDPVTFQRALREMADAGAEVCALEASSIGLSEGRLEGTKIHTAVFTNFTQDHLDYHGDMTSYWEAKKRLFDWPELRAAVVNVDDPKGFELVDALRRKKSLDLWTVSSKGDARLKALAIRPEPQGLTFELAEGEDAVTLRSNAVGRYNVDNLLGVIGALRSLGIPLQQCALVCAGLPSVPGRLELQSGAHDPQVFVDYAHTPDALQKVLEALRPLASKNQGKLITVFGCGGQRDRAKRQLMGRVASEISDLVIVTSDNPRDEDPQGIMAEIQRGVLPSTMVELCLDRLGAIQRAIEVAQPQDVVLVAGKGHETYQEIAGEKIPFSDQEEVRRALQRWRSKRTPRLVDLNSDRA